MMSTRRSEDPCKTMTSPENCRGKAPSRGSVARAACAASCLLALIATNAWSASVDTIRLALEARLFRAKTGSLSPDVLAPDGPPLVNVIASPDPPSATLIVVVVKLPPGESLSSDTLLRLTVREQLAHRSRARVMFDRRVKVGAIESGGTTHLGFWLEGTGCKPLSLVAKLSVAGTAEPMSVSATLPFACGE